MVERFVFLQWAQGEIVVSHFSDRLLKSDNSLNIGSWRILDSISLDQSPSRLRIRKKVVANGPSILIQ